MIKSSGREEIGDEAADYIENEAYVTSSVHGRPLLAVSESMSDETVDMLTGALGRPGTIDRGEVAYWDLSDMWEHDN